jgi:hypothetical protein
MAQKKHGLMFVSALSTACIHFKRIIAKQTAFRGMMQKDKQAQRKLLIACFN